MPPGKNRLAAVAVEGGAFFGRLRDIAKDRDDLLDIRLVVGLDQFFELFDQHGGVDESSQSVGRSGEFGLRARDFLRCQSLKLGLLLIDQGVARRKIRSDSNSACASNAKTDKRSDNFCAHCSERTGTNSLSQRHGH